MPTKKPLLKLKDVPLDVRNKGFVKIGGLAAGTIILVETVARIYECAIIEKGTAMVQSSWPGFEGRLKCKIVGSVDGNGNPFAGLLLHEHHMMLVTPDGKHTTGRMLGITLRGKSKETGKSWVYELWSRPEQPPKPKEQPKRLND